MGADSTKDFIIRLGEVSDLPLLYLMLYEAAAANPAIRQLDREAALSLPQVRKYVEGWGRRGDQAVVAAEHTGRQLGAAWYRLFTAQDPAYGFVSEDVPEVTMGVVDNARGRGIGSALLKRIVEQAREEGFDALSLSVEADSEAVALYERHGFELVGKSKQRPTSNIMILRL